MYNAEIAMGILIWFLATLISYIFVTDLGASFINRLIDSIRLDFSRSAGWKIIPSSLQAIGIYWVLLGVVLNLIGKACFIEFAGGILLAVIMIGPPAVVCAIFARNRR